MKILVNKNNPQIRITAPEIEEYLNNYFISCNDTAGRSLILQKSDWTLVEEELVEDWRENRKKECPFRRADGCERYADAISECTGNCSWVVDYPKLKEIQDKKEQKQSEEICSKCIHGGKNDDYCYNLHGKRWINGNGLYKCTEFCEKEQKQSEVNFEKLALERWPVVMVPKDPWDVDEDGSEEDLNEFDRDAYLQGLKDGYKLGRIAQIEQNKALTAQVVKLSKEKGGSK